MTGQYLANSAAFLIQTLFGLYILAVLLRFLFQLLRAHFRNPVSQFIVTVTNPALRPLRRFIPGYAGIDIASISDKSYGRIPLDVTEHFLAGII